MFSRLLPESEVKTGALLQRRIRPDAAAVAGCHAMDDGQAMLVPSTSADEYTRWNDLNISGAHRSSATNRGERLRFRVGDTPAV